MKKRLLALSMIAAMTAAMLAGYGTAYSGWKTGST